MNKVPVNEVLAENLRHYMANSADLNTQTALATRAGLAQRTIGNYLRPALRQEGSKGKQPSAKLAELEKIAEALHIEVWQLLRPTTPLKRALADGIQQLVEDAVSSTRTMHPPLAPLVLHDGGAKYRVTAATPAEASRKRKRAG